MPPKLRRSPAPIRAVPKSLTDPEELFRPFTQRSRDRGGLGLGLSISQRGIEANGGKLYVRNRPGQGCVFTIDLRKRLA